MPLATFTGWNPRHPEQGAPGDLMSMMGSTLPFPLHARGRASARAIRARRSRSATARARLPRRACARRSRAAVAARHVLAEDVDAIVERAGQLWDLVHRGL